MSAPRPEGMSDKRLEEMQRRLQAAKTSFDAARSRIDDPPGLWIDLFNVLTDATEAYGQIQRLRADWATLRERVKELEFGENRLLAAMVKERARADSAEARFDTLAKDETTWMCGCGSLSGVNLTHCGRCNRPRAEFEIAKPVNASKQPTCGKCQHWTVLAARDEGPRVGQCRRMFASVKTVETFEDFGCTFYEPASAPKEPTT